MQENDLVLQLGGNSQTLYREDWSTCSCSDPMLAMEEDGHEAGALFGSVHVLRNRFCGYLAVVLC